MQDGIRLVDKLSSGIGKGAEDALVMSANVLVELFGPDGELKEQREVHNTVPTVGKNHVADQLSASPGEAAMGWMAIGTGTPSATQLGVELDKNALTSRTDSAAVVTYVGNWAAGDGTGAITEAGVFNSVTPATGTMLVSASFTVINKGALDTLAVTWTLTIS